jgi:hypothetical protein
MIHVINIAHNHHFDDETFVRYTKYFLHWKQPKYAKFIVYVSFSLFLLHVCVTFGGLLNST